MLRYFYLLLTLQLVSGTLSMAQDSSKHSSDKYISSELVPLTGKQGISWQTPAGDFLFKPYTLIQTTARMNRYDDEGLELSEKDHILNSGFGIPYAMLGFSGKAFGKVSFNVALNAATSGAALLNQAWFDINCSDALRFRVGKFKTPFNQAYLVQLGETLFPLVPTSLSTAVNVPFDINSVNPNIATGFDIGVQMHGLLANKYEYRLGVFNGTGISVNDPQKSMSDQYKIPALLYAARFAWMPKGAMPVHQGNADDLQNNKLLIAASTSINLEANYESSNDFRTGIEFAWLYHRFYVSAEAYALHLSFVERQKTSPNYTFTGGYAQMGYFITPKLQPCVRVESFDRNGTSRNGQMFLPAVGINYYIAGYNLKLQAMYQQLRRWGYDSDAEANDDDNSMAEHAATVLLQFSF